MELDTVARASWDEAEPLSTPPAANYEPVPTSGPITMNPATPERLAAVMRWRARRLFRLMAPREAAAVRLIPALLRWKLPFPGVGQEAACRSRGFRVGKRSLQVAERLGVRPVPSLDDRRGPVEAVTVLRQGTSLTVFLLMGSDVRPDGVHHVEARGHAIQRVLEAAGVKVVVRTGAADDPALAEARGAMAAFGGLIAGTLRPTFWKSPAVPLADLVAAAPTALARLCLAATGEQEVRVGEALGRVLERHDARAVSDPEMFCGSLAVSETAKRPLILRLLAVAASRPETREWAGSRLQLGESSDGGALLELGRRVALHCSRTVRRASPPGSPLRDWWWREIGALGVPEALLPALAVALTAPFTVVVAKLPGRGRRTFEVRDARQAVVSRGPRELQARLRAVALWARLHGPQAAPPDSTDTSRSLVSLLAARPESEQRWLLLDSREDSGTPSDPLNRGTDRHTTVAYALALHLSPRRPLHALSIDPVGAPVLAAQFARAHDKVGVLSVRLQARAVAGRVEQIVRLAGDPRAGPPLAIESGGMVFLLERRVRSWPASAWARRPRWVTVDPSAPDLTLAPDVGRTGMDFSGNGMGCLCSLAEGDQVRILFRDQASRFLQGTIPLAALGEHLRLTGTLLSQAPVPTSLSVRMTPEVAELVRRVGVTAGPATAVSIGGTTPLGLRVRVAGEWFGGGQPAGWIAAAEAILSTWRIDTPGRVIVSEASVTEDGNPVSGLRLLHACTVARRRLEAAIERAVRRSYR